MHDISASSPPTFMLCIKPLCKRYISSPWTDKRVQTQQRGRPAKTYELLFCSKQSTDEHKQPSAKWML